jgi:hypothetical protein
MARFNRTNFYKHETVNGVEVCDLLNNYYNQLFQIKRNVQYYTLRFDDVGRPDLLSYKLYDGIIDYWWILLKVNDIGDIWNDMNVGDVIMVPDSLDIEDFYTAVQNIKSS